MPFKRQTAAEDQVKPFVAARAALLHQATPPPAASDQRARPEQVLDGGDEFERIERLLQKGVSARGQRLVSSLQDGNGEHGPSLVLLQAPAQFRAPTSGDHQLHDRELRPTLEPLLLGVAHRQSQVHLVALGAQEELRQIRGHRITFGEQHEQPRTTASVVVRQGLAGFALFGQQPVSVGRRQAARNLRRDEAQLLHLVARVEPVSPRAAFRDDRPVALLPVADRRGRNPQHSSHRTDAVDAATPAKFIRHARDANRSREMRAREPYLMRNT